MSYSHNSRCEFGGLIHKDTEGKIKGLPYTKKELITIQKHSCSTSSHILIWLSLYFFSNHWSYHGLMISITDGVTSNSGQHFSNNNSESSKTELICHGLSTCLSKCVTLQTFNWQIPILVHKSAKLEFTMKENRSYGASCWGLRIYKAILKTSGNKEHIFSRSILSILSNFNQKKPFREMAEIILICK